MAVANPVGPETLSISVSPDKATLVFTASTNGSDATFTKRDFLNGPDPYSASPQFTGSDYLIFQFYKTGSTGNLRIRFAKQAAITDYFQFTVSCGPNAGWQTARVLRSTAATTGSPSWDSITAIEFANLDAGNGILVDDMYFLYGNAPPAFGVVAQHKDRIVGGAVPTNSTTLATVYFSNASQPDSYPAANFQEMTGSNNSLLKANQVLALKEYADAVVVGLPNAVISWTIGSDGNPSKSTITTEFGIDSQRSIVETAAGSLMFTWQRGIYILRPTGRLYASAKIATYLDSLSLDDARWTMAVTDEKTKTIRYWFRTGTGQTNTTLGFIFDYVGAQDRGEPVWPSTMSQMADIANPGYVNSVREILYAKFGDPQIYRMGAGTTEDLPCSIRLPWIARDNRDKLEKVIGVHVAYTATTPVKVYIRYAQQPGEFDSAAFALITTLPVTTTNAVHDGRVAFGKTSRWAQVEFRTDKAGFELFPPVNFIGIPTQRVP
jgi:hypothetical protein